MRVRLTGEVITRPSSASFVRLLSRAMPRLRPLLGTCMRGHGVPQDYVEAVKWFRRAAEQGFADAQDSLARMYVQGQGVPKDYV
jgi:TPR repeat protein